MEPHLPQLWLLDLRPYFENDRWRALLPFLPPQRRSRALACRKREDAARIAGAGFLLQHALCAAGIRVCDQVFETGSWGKPRLVSCDLAFSLSHAGSYAVCALGASAVGVDVDVPRITMNVAARWFHPQELSFLRALPEPSLPDALLRIWTAKESYTKLLGTGLHTPFDSFCVLLSDTGAALFQDGCPLAPQLYEYKLQGARLCLCTTGARPALRIFVPAP